VAELTRERDRYLRHLTAGAQSIKAAEDKVARLEGEVQALEWFSETSAANAVATKKHLDDLNKSAALTEGDTPNG
jgi:hypothetical protein